jgi:hypothetical protein
MPLHVLEFKFSRDRAATQIAETKSSPEDLAIWGLVPFCGRYSEFYPQFFS